MDAIATLCSHIVCNRWEDLPAPAIAATKTFVLDSLGVAVAGSAGPLAAELASIQSAWGIGDDARVIVHGQRLPAPAAAVVHPMPCVLPAALAHAERSGGVAGRDFVLAVALGVDVACHFGIGARARFRFFRPANAGAFGRRLRWVVSWASTRPCCNMRWGLRWAN
jgi:aconitate decarboxylase